MINNLKIFVNKIVPVQAMNLYVGWRYSSTLNLYFSFRALSITNPQHSTNKMHKVVR